jgi:hypothetical protein
VPKPTEQRAEYKLTPAGMEVMDILNRQGSGYGREQLLVIALRLACRRVVEARPEENEGDLLLDYLRKADEVLDDA